MSVVVENGEDIGMRGEEGGRREEEGGRREERAIEVDRREKFFGLLLKSISFEYMTVSDTP